MEIEITLFEKSDGPLTKRISFVDGKVTSDGSACSMARGRARRRLLAGVTELAPLIEGLKSNEAITLGALRRDLPDEVEIATKDKLDRQPSDGAVARTGDNIEYAEGKPGLILLDYDTKGMPSGVAARIESLGGFWNALASVLPELREAGHLLRRSTSSGLVRSDTGEAMPGSSGMHGYIEATDASDTVRFLSTLHDRCWLAGLGWCIVSKAGALLERSIIDKMVGQPERLVFEGPPVVEPPLRQDAASRRAEVHAGRRVDTFSACPPLTAAEEQAKAALRREEDHRLGAETKQVRETYIDEEARKLIGHRKSMTLKEARAAIVKRVGGTLLADFILPWDDLESNANVGVVLDRPDIFEGHTLADPIEGTDYGRCKAKVMIGDDGIPFINSFAHGHAVYRLRYDAHAVRERVDKAEDKPTTLARLLIAADVDAVETAKLIKEVAKEAGVGVNAIKSVVKEVRAEHNK